MGSFKKDEHGNYVYVPDGSENYGPSTGGVQQLQPAANAETFQRTVGGPRKGAGSGSYRTVGREASLPLISGDFGKSEEDRDNSFLGGVWSSLKSIGKVPGAFKRAAEDTFRTGMESKQADQLQAESQKLMEQSKQALAAGDTERAKMFQNQAEAKRSGAASFYQSASKTPSLDRFMEGADQAVKGTIEFALGKPSAAGESPEEAQAAISKGYNSPEYRQANLQSKERLKAQGVITDNDFVHSKLLPGIQQGLNVGSAFTGPLGLVVLPTAGSVAGSYAADDKEHVWRTAGETAGFGIPAAVLAKLSGMRGPREGTPRERLAGQHTPEEPLALPPGQIRPAAPVETPSVRFAPTTAEAAPHVSGVAQATSVTATATPEPVRLPAGQATATPVTTPTTTFPRQELTPADKQFATEYRDELINKHINDNMAADVNFDFERGGNLIFDENGEVTGRTPNISNKPEWVQKLQDEGLSLQVIRTALKNRDPSSPIFQRVIQEAERQLEDGYVGKDFKLPASEEFRKVQEIAGKKAPEPQAMSQGEQSKELDQLFDSKTPDLITKIDNAQKALNEAGAPPPIRNAGESDKAYLARLHAGTELPEHFDKMSPETQIQILQDRDLVANPSPEEQAALEADVAEASQVKGVDGKVAYVKAVTGQGPNAQALTQKQRVAQSVAQRGQATPREVAEDTAIKEPNVRRILGQDVKNDGSIFERVDRGVYRITTQDGRAKLYVEVANSLERFPQLVEEGLRGDMIYLDIPYDLPSVRGGSRGSKYELIKPSQFKTIAEAAAKAVRTDNSQVYFQISDTVGDKGANEKFLKMFLGAGFQEVGRGYMVKTDASGKLSLNVRGEEQAPELTVLYTKSGQVDGDLDSPILDFTVVRKQGYQTEKDAGMIGRMIEQSTRPGEMVVDPFAGSGVVGDEALKLGRDVYLLESDPNVVKSFINPRILESQGGRLTPEQYNDALEARKDYMREKSRERGRKPNETYIDRKAKKALSAVEPRPGDVAVPQTEAEHMAQAFEIKTETAQKLLDRHGSDKAATVLARLEDAKNVKNRDAFAVAEARKQFGGGQVKVGKKSEAPAVDDGAGMDEIPPATNDGVAGAGDPEEQPGFHSGSVEEHTDAIGKMAGVDITKPSYRVRDQNTFVKGVTGFPSIGEIWKSGVVDPIRKFVAEKIYAGIASQNQALAAVMRSPRLIFANFGLDDAKWLIIRRRNDAHANSGTTLRFLGKDLYAKINQMADKAGIEPAAMEAQVNKRLYQVFESPEFIERKFGEGTPKLTLQDLSAAEREIADQLISLNKRRNDINYEIGRINKEQWEKFRNGMHSPRIMDVDAEKNGFQSGPFDLNVGKKQKEVGEYSDEVFGKVLDSPVQSMLARMEIALWDKATYDSLRALEKGGLIVDKAPNRNFTTLTGKKWGVYEGKAMDNQILTAVQNKFVFNSETGQLFSDLLDQYRYSKLGAMDRFFKSVKTTLAPATGVGNYLSNVLGFTPGAGVSIPRNLAAGPKMAYRLMLHDAGIKFDAGIYEMRKHGVFSERTGKTILGDRSEELTSIARKHSKNPYKIAQAIYGGTDDLERAIVFEQLKQKGMSSQLAALRVSQFTQDYARAGRLIQTLADIPIGGKPFARFIPEFVRIIKNNAVYSPVGLFARVATLGWILNKLSDNSGETEEERQAREEAAGQTQLPGTAWINKLVGGPDRDISLNLAVGDHAVNIARDIGLNFPQEPGGSAQSAFWQQMSPVAIPIRRDADGNTVFNPSELVSSLTFRPIAEQFANRDYLGREITDPHNKILYEDGKMKIRQFEGTPSDAEGWGNRLKHLSMAYLPFSNEAQAVVAAERGKQDFYGKERTTGEALLRAIGLKVESNDPEARQRRVDVNQYYEVDQKRLTNWLHDNPDLVSTYFTYDNPTRKRPEDGDFSAKTEKVSDLISPEKWSIVSSEKSGRLFDFLKKEAYASNASDNKPIDPIYDLDVNQRREVLQLRSRPTGDDVEREEILRATTQWFEKFEQKERDYYDASNKWFEEQDFSNSKSAPNKRVTAYNDIKYPEQNDLMKQYYQIKEQDPAKAKQFFKDHSELGDMFEAYKMERLKWVNAKRAIEGYPPISTAVWTNVTFGFEPDERKVETSLHFKGKEGKIQTGKYAEDGSFETTGKYGSGLSIMRRSDGTRADGGPEFSGSAGSSSKKGKVKVKKAKRGGTGTRVSIKKVKGSFGRKGSAKIRVHGTKGKKVKVTVKTTPVKRVKVKRGKLL